jgi:hypothetical protein
MAATHRLTLIYRVPDVERWHDVMVRHADGREGMVRRTVFRSLDDPSEFMVELEFSSARAAKSFLPSVDLRAILDEIGMDVYPPVFIGEEIKELHAEYP